MSYIAAFDLGTTNTKGVLVDEQASIAFENNIPMEVSQAQGSVEQHPEDWYKAVTEIAQHWFRSGIDPASIKLISFSGQMQDCIPVGADMLPVRPAILYSDGRAGEQAARLLAELGEDEVTRETANHMDGTLTLPKMLWLQEQEPDSYAKAASFLISSKDYIIARLTGQFVTDPTSAATTGMMQLHSRSWMTSWLERLGLDAAKLPQIIGADQIAGTVHAQGAQYTGFAEGTPVLCGIGDAGAATLGAGVYEEGEVYAYLGTTGWVAAASAGLMDVSSGAFNLAYVEPGRQISIAPMMNAGSAHRWAVDTFGPSASLPADVAGGSEADNTAVAKAKSAQDNAFEAFERAVAEAERESGVLFLPYLYGERCPVQDSLASGSFIGLRAATTRAQMGAAVLEGVAYSIRQVMELVVSRDAKLRVTLIGGGAKSKVWCQTIANVLQCELVVPDDSQYLPSIGAALLGFAHLGWGDELGELCGRIKAAQAVQTFTPDAALADYYDKQFARYKRMYAHLQPLFQL